MRNPPTGHQAGTQSVRMPTNSSPVNETGVRAFVIID